MRHVLIVDDDPDIRTLLRLSLELDGYSVETANDGVAALDMLLHADEPWIVLLDITMPRMTGLEVCAHLSAMPGLASRHLVILMSAGILPDGDTPPCVRALLAKPFNLNDLADLLADMSDSASMIDDEPGSEMMPANGVQWGSLTPRAA